MTLDENPVIDFEPIDEKGSELDFEPINDAPKESITPSQDYGGAGTAPASDPYPAPPAWMDAPEAPPEVAQQARDAQETAGLAMTALTIPSRLDWSDEYTPEQKFLEQNRRRAVASIERDDLKEKLKTPNRLPQEGLNPNSPLTPEYRATAQAEERVKQLDTQIGSLAESAKSPAVIDYEKRARDEEMAQMERERMQKATLGEAPNPLLGAGLRLGGTLAGQIGGAAALITGDHERGSLAFELSNVENQIRQWTGVDDSTANRIAGTIGDTLGLIISPTGKSGLARAAFSASVAARAAVHAYGSALASGADEGQAQKSAVMSAVEMAAFLGIAHKGKSVIEGMVGKLAKGASPAALAAEETLKSGVANMGASGALRFAHGEGFAPTLESAVTDWTFAAHGGMNAFGQGRAQIRQRAAELQKQQQGQPVSSQAGMQQQPINVNIAPEPAPTAKKPAATVAAPDAAETARILAEDAAKQKSAEPAPSSLQDLMTERNKLVVQELPKHGENTNGRQAVQDRILELDREIREKQQQANENLVIGENAEPIATPTAKKAAEPVASVSPEVKPGKWDGSNIGEQPITALRLLDGTILLDPSARIHAQAFENLGVDPTTVADGGFVRGNEYKTSGADTARIVRQANAKKSLEEKKSPAPENLPPKVETAIREGTATPDQLQIATEQPLLFDTPKQKRDAFVLRDALRAKIDEVEAGEYSEQQERNHARLTEMLGNVEKQIADNVKPSDIPAPVVSEVAKQESGPEAARDTRSYLDRVLDAAIEKGIREVTIEVPEKNRNRDDLSKAVAAIEGRGLSAATDGKSILVRGFRELAKEEPAKAEPAQPVRDASDQAGLKITRDAFDALDKAVASGDQVKIHAVKRIIENRPRDEIDAVLDERNSAKSAEPAPVLRPGEKQGDLLAGRADDAFNLAGEVQKQPAPKAAEPRTPSKAEMADAALRAYGSYERAIESLKTQMGGETTAEAKKRAEITMRELESRWEDEEISKYQKEQLDAVREHEDSGGDELLSVLKKLGGLPLIGKEKVLGGEFKKIFEMPRGKHLRMKMTSKFQSKSLDAIRQELEGHGHYFETPVEMLDAIGRAMRGERIIGSERQMEGGQEELLNRQSLSDKAPASPMHVDAVQKVANSLITRFKGAAETVVITDGQQYPDAVKAKAKAQGIDLNRIGGAVHDGKVYLNAAGLSSPERAAEVFFHEQAGHMGADGLLDSLSPKSSSRLMDALRREFPAETKYVAERYGKGEHLNETLARIMEKFGPESDASPKDQTRWRRVVDFVRTILAKSGIKRWSKADIEALLRRGIEKVRSGKGSGSEGTKMSLEEDQYLKPRSSEEPWTDAERKAGHRQMTRFNPDLARPEAMKGSDYRYPTPKDIADAPHGFKEYPTKLTSNLVAGDKVFYSDKWRTVAGVRAAEGAKLEANHWVDFEDGNSVHFFGRNPITYDRNSESTKTGAESSSLSGDTRNTYAAGEAAASTGSERGAGVVKEGDGVKFSIEEWNAKRDAYNANKNKAKEDDMFAAAPKAEPILMSSKNAFQAEEARKRGESPIESDFYRSNPEVAEAARVAMDKNPEAVDTVIRHLLEEGRDTRKISIQEEAMLVHRGFDLKRQVMSAERIIENENSTPAQKAMATDSFIEAQGKLIELANAMHASGEVWGAFGSFRQRIFQDDFSPASMARTLEKAKNDKLTDAEIAEIEIEAKNIERLRAEKEKAEEAAVDIQRDDAAQDAFDKAARYHPKVLEYAEGIVSKWEAEAIKARKDLREAMGMASANPLSLKVAAALFKIARAKIARGSLNAAEFSTEMVAEFGDSIKTAIQPAWNLAMKAIGKLDANKERKKTPKQKKAEKTAMDEAESIEDGIKAVTKDPKALNDGFDSYVKKLANEYVRMGETTVAGVIEKLHKFFDPMMPDLTDNALKDAWTDYGKGKEATTDPTKMLQSQLRYEALLERKISELEKLKSPAATASKRVKQTERAGRLLKEIAELKKKLPPDEGNAAGRLQSSLDAMETRARNRIAELRYEIAKGERTLKQKGLPPTSPKLEALRAELEEVKAEHLERFGKRQMTEEQKLKAAIRSAENSEKKAVAELVNARKGIFAKPATKGVSRFKEVQAVLARAEAARAETKALKGMDTAMQEAKKVESLESQIEKLESTLAEGKFAPKEKESDPTVETEAVTNLQAKRDALAAMLAEKRKAARPVPDAELRELKRLESELASLMVGRAKPQKKMTVDTEQQAFAREQLAAKRAELAEIRANDEMLKISNRKAAMLRQLADLADRTARGDFEPRKKKPALDLSKDPDAMNLAAELTKKKADFAKRVEKYRLAHLTPVQRGLINLGKTWDATRNLFLSFDLSAFLQTAAAAAAHPIEAGKALGKGAKAMAFTLFSDRYAHELQERARQEPLYKNGTFKKMGLEISETMGEAREENMVNVLERLGEIQTRWKDMPEAVKKLIGMRGVRNIVSGPLDMTKLAAKGLGRGLKASNVAFGAIAGHMRMVAAKAMLRRHFADGNATDAQLKLIGAAANTFTGKGGLKNGGALNRLFFAPNYYLSIMKGLTGWDMGKAAIAGEGKATAAIAEEYVRAIATIVTVGSIAYLLGDKDKQDINPLNSNFGKFVWEGGTSTDLSMGRGAYVTQLARYITGRTKENGKISKRDRNTGLALFLAGRFSREIKMATAILDGESYDKKLEGPLDYFKESSVPLAWRDLDKVLEKEGITRGAFLQMLNLLGITSRIPDEKKSSGSINSMGSKIKSDVKGGIGLGKKDLGL